MHCHQGDFQLHDGFHPSYYQGAERVEGPATSVNDVEEEEEEEPEDILKANADSEDIEDMDSCCDEPRC